ncbi:MAG: TolC family protein [Bacteroidia bacterium]
MTDIKITKPFITLLVLLVTTSNFLFAQQTGLLTIQDATQFVAKNYPALKAKQADFNAAEKNISLAKISLVPSLDASYQFNYSTYNNITGLFFPQGILPISGPPSATNNYSGTVGSAGSLYMNWQPITFGLRTAQIKLANADASNKNYDLQNEIFKQQLNLISVYLDALVTDEVVKVYQENLQRTNFNFSLSKSLTVSGLRPGVDTALFAAEKAKAEIDLMNVQKQFSVQQIILSQQLGSDSVKISMDTTYFHHLPKAFDNTAKISSHPFYNLYLSQVEYQKAKEKTIKLDVLPKLNLWGITYARGSGAGSNTPTDGFTFSRYNYGAGVQLTMPLLHFADVRLKYKQQQFLTQSFEEKLNQVDLDLRKQQEISDTTYANAIRIISKTEIQLSASQYAYNAMKGRYEAGLANYADFIQAQYNLVKSQTDLKKAYWDVWKALLNEAATKGDLNIFLKN